MRNDVTATQRDPRGPVALGGEHFEICADLIVRLPCYGGEGRRSGFSERRFKDGDVLLDGATAHSDTRD
jgi:hypothetical protein